jgi:hypothetical protein
MHLQCGILPIEQPVDTRGCYPLIHSHHDTTGDDPRSVVGTIVSWHCGLCNTASPEEKSSKGNHAEDFALLHPEAIALTCSQRTRRPLTPGAKHQPESCEDAYHRIEPLHNLHLASEQPMQLRTFKPKYHLTMGMHAVLGYLNLLTSVQRSRTPPYLS